MLSELEVLKRVHKKGLNELEVLKRVEEEGPK